MSHQAPNSRSTIKSALLAHSVEPSRGMGQNFLSDVEVARWITEQLDICPEDTILEIGPGLGALTQHLIGKGRRLILLEKDPKLAARLREELHDQPVEIIEGDAIWFNLRSLYKEQPLKVIGALPYSCGTEIVRNFMGNPSPVTRAVFVMQKEVIDRFCAPPSTPDRGLLSLRVQARWRTENLRILPPDVFVPQPKVHSAVMAMTPRPRAELPTFDEKLYDRLLRMGFNQRRKMLRKTLPAHPTLAWPVLAAEIKALETARAEELTLPQWVNLSRLYDTHALKDVPQKADEIFDHVDDEDRVIGQKTRGEVHAQGLIHRAIHIFVFNKYGELLLQKRSHLKDAMPEKWDSSAAGHVDSGEDYLPAAVRELEEELGITTTAEKLQKLVKIRPCAATGFEWVELYRAEHDGDVTFPSSEIECLEWFTVPEIAAWVAARPQDFAAGFVECWAQAQGIL
jgi:16S rRNA (adenine1518-N6/adenine1519-N6)-dimethyltransferase